MAENPRSPASMRSTLKAIGFMVPVMILILVIIVGIFRWRDDTASAGPSPSPPTTQAPMPTPSATPSDDEDKPDVPPKRAAKAPSKALVLQFERAFNTPNPADRKTLLGKVATPQYVAANTTNEPDRTKGLTVVIDATASIVRMSCDTSGLSCYVVTRVTITSMRNGATVNTFQAPLHATEWINTSAGWRTASEAELR